MILKDVYYGFSKEACTKQADMLMNIMQKLEWQMETVGNKGIFLQKLGTTFLNKTPSDPIIETMPRD